MIKKHIKFLLDKSSDGCTGVPDFNFTSCCKKHDFYYRNGNKSKIASDFELAKCIWNKGHSGLSLLYFAGTALLGWQHYNWKKRRNYKKSLK